jgi:hypothetical protein
MKFRVVEVSGKFYPQVATRGWKKYESIEQGYQVFHLFGSENYIYSSTHGDDSVKEALKTILGYWDYDHRDVSVNVIHTFSNIHEVREAFEALEKADEALDG